MVQKLLSKYPYRTVIKNVKKRIEYIEVLSGYKKILLVLFRVFDYKLKACGYDFLAILDYNILYLYHRFLPLHWEVEAIGLAVADPCSPTQHA